MQTNVTELPDSRARVEVAVEPAEVEKRLKAAAAKLGGEMKIPGFRKGKVPPEMVLQRLGRQTVLTEALRELARRLVRACDGRVRRQRRSAIRSWTSASSPMPGEPLEFAIEVAVRPPAELGEYKGLEVGRAET